MNLPEEYFVRRGEWRVIRVDGSIELVESKPTLHAIYGAIGCEICDTVLLSERGGRPTIIMMVDDTGMIDHKPVNPKASALMRNLHPGYLYDIHGDVAIVHDSDFK